MRAFRRVIGKIVAAIAAILFLLFLVTYIINSHDEELTPEARVLLAPPPNPWTSDENIYVGLAGLDAPAGQSVLTVGETRIAAYNGQLDVWLADPSLYAEALTRTDPRALVFKGKLDCCQPTTSSIWNQARIHQADIVRLLEDNKELYQRYLGLHLPHGYYETARPSFYEPFYVLPPYVKALFLANVALQLEADARSEKLGGLAELSQDVQLWRAVLEGEGTLTSKLVAAAYLHADFLLLADMVADPNFDLRLFDGDGAQILTPFPMSSWHLGKAYYHETRTYAAFIQQTLKMQTAIAASTSGPFGWWERLNQRVQLQYIKPHATENFHASVIAELARLSDADPVDYSKRRAAFQQWEQKHTAIPSLGLVYDPIGKILVDIAVSGYQDYPLRMFDVAAVQRLVYLVYQIRRQAIDAAGIPEFLKQHPELSTHPIDAVSFSWNPVTQELAVRPVGHVSPGMRFSVRLQK